MEEIKKEYEEKNTAFLIKYADVIKAIAIKNEKDLGVGADMLKAVARGNEEYGKDIEINLEELKADYEELENLSKKINEGA